MLCGRRGGDEEVLRELLEAAHRALGDDVLAVADGMRGGFVVVPMNLVAVRWLRREQGWVPGVVGHLVRLRTR